MTKIKISTAISLVLALLGCGSPKNSPTATTGQEATSSPSQVSETCPSGNFDKFFQVFERDNRVQQVHTADPLDKEFVDANAEPEPKLIHDQVRKEVLSFPLIPTPGQQVAKSLTLTKSRLSDNEMQVKLSKEDTDYQVTFFFHLSDCWTLYRIRDDSL